MPADVSYQTLDPGRIIVTLEALERRIGERFPNSGLAKISGELRGIARQTTERIAGIARPYIGLRLLLAVVLAAGVTCIAWLVLFALRMEASNELTNVMQGADAGVSLLIVLGGSALYLSTLESRWRRDQALKALHEFRSIVHVIDMHQLTKDPTAVLKAHEPTAASPVRTMSRFELTRYLDYCAEMLALIGKLAALYADEMRDSVVIDAVNEMENLTTGLAQKMWQKIMLIDATGSAGA
jgi:hypothetical protein